MGSVCHSSKRTDYFTGSGKRDSGLSGGNALPNEKRDEDTTLNQILLYCIGMKTKEQNYCKEVKGHEGTRERNQEIMKSRR